MSSHRTIRPRELSLPYASVLNRIRILESNPAKHMKFFRFGLDIVFLSTGFRNRMSKWNQIWPCKKSWYGTIVVWGKITIFRNHILKIYLSDSLDRLQCSPPLGILTFRMRTSQTRCGLDLCEDEHNWFYSFVTTQPVIIEMRQVHFWNVFINRSYCSKIQQTNFSLAASFWGIGCTKFGRMSQIST